MLYFGMVLINSYFGWYGYERWKYRRVTYGDIRQSVSRKVFVKKLMYESNVDLKYFKVYLEKGYWCGYDKLDDTRFENTSKYPYQVSFNNGDTIKNVVFNISNYNKFDSIDNNILNVCVYLEKPYLKDTIVLKIIKFDGSKDSIGYIKVWDKTNKK